MDTKCTGGQRSLQRKGGLINLFFSCCLIQLCFMATVKCHNLLTVQFFFLCFFHPPDSFSLFISFSSQDVKHCRFVRFRWHRLIRTRCHLASVPWRSGHSGVGCLEIIVLFKRVTMRQYGWWLRSPFVCSMRHHFGALDLASTSPTHSHPRP